MKLQAVEVLSKEKKEKFSLVKLRASASMSGVNLEHFLSVFLVGIMGLFPVVNPFSTIPVFLSLTGGLDAGKRERIALRCSVWAGAIMLTFFFIGTLILSFLGISLDAVRAAGGLMVTFIGFRMLFEIADAPSHDTPASPADHGQLDPSLVPLAMPSLSGPGALSVIMTGSAQIAQTSGWAVKLTDYFIVALVIVTISVTSWLVLRASLNITRVLGASGLEAFKKIMGFLLICLGVQFFANGCLGFIENAAKPHTAPATLVRPAP
ncbi:MAG: MarC family NAAT transporter [Verrucomicrobiales bacterium]|jgi:multiple antibiotic resistance protein|nr:MarC family NAAT transporter [Verrucomicrobiales bacterium]